MVVHTTQKWWSDGSRPRKCASGHSSSSCKYPNDLRRRFQKLIKMNLLSQTLLKTKMRSKGALLRSKSRWLRHVSMSNLTQKWRSSMSRSTRRRSSLSGSRYLRPLKRRKRLQKLKRCNLRSWVRHFWASKECSQGKKTKQTQTNLLWAPALTCRKRVKIQLSYRKEACRWPYWSPFPLIEEPQLKLVEASWERRIRRSIGEINWDSGAKYSCPQVLSHLSERRTRMCSNHARSLFLAAYKPLSLQLNFRRKSRSHWLMVWEGRLAYT